MDLIHSIEKAIPEELELGLSIIHSDGTYYGLNDTRLFPLASISKFIAAAATLKLKANVSPELIHKAISEHCNHSFQSLVHICDTSIINRELASIGLNIEIEADNTSLMNNIGDSKSLVSILNSIVNNNLLDSVDTNLILEGMRLQSDPDGFRFNRFPNISWLHMTGGLEGVCNDMGYVQRDGKNIICVGLVRSVQETEWRRLENTLNQVGKIIHEYLV